MTATPWTVVPLSGDHDRNAFDCGKAPLNGYLKRQAGQDLRSGASAPFVAVASTQPRRVCGYYTLSSYGIEPASLPAEVVKKLPRYPLLPATLLGRLARDVAFAGRGLGEYLLIDALRRAYRGSKEIGAVAVVVDAMDDEARAFYLHFDFIAFPDRPGRLFLPMKAIAALFPAI